MFLVKIVDSQGFLYLVNNYIPFALECIFTRNPLAPKVPWNNLIDYSLRISNRRLYLSFTAVALRHWDIASKQYVSNSIGNKQLYPTCKKFAYAIRFLDFGLQLVKKGEINDFELYDKIRTEIDNKTFVFVVVFLILFSLYKEIDFFVYLEKAWKELANFFKYLKIDELRILEEGVNEREKAMQKLLNLEIPSSVFFEVSDSMR